MSGYSSPPKSLWRGEVGDNADTREGGWRGTIFARENVRWKGRVSVAMILIYLDVYVWCGKR